MSLHAAPSPEVSKSLAAQRRRSTISSLVIALLLIAFFGIVLAIWILPSLRMVTPDLVSYRGTFEKEVDLSDPTLPTFQRRPSAPSLAASRVIASTVPSPVSIPQPVVEVTEPSVEFGTGDDFGAGFGGSGSGSGTGGGSGFGTPGAIPGSLTGRLYDFKQKPDGAANEDYPTDPGAIQAGDKYIEIVTDLHRRNFSPSLLKNYYRAPYELSLTHLAIPFQPASEGPKYFGAAEEVQPSGWMALYKGTLVAPSSGKFRFVGFADDYLAVHVNNRPRLIACWPDIQERMQERWEPGRDSGEWRSPVGADQKLITGDWISLKAGERFDMELTIGERPGGMVGFVLFVQKQGVEYRKASDGRPILPLFTTSGFSVGAMDEIDAQFPGYEFEWADVPVFQGVTAK